MVSLEFFPTFPKAATFSLLLVDKLFRGNFALMIVILSMHSIIITRKKSLSRAVMHWLAALSKLVNYCGCLFQNNHHEQTCIYKTILGIQSKLSTVFLIHPKSPDYELFGKSEFFCMETYSWVCPATSSSSTPLLATAAMSSILDWLLSVNCLKLTS